MHNSGVFHGGATYKVEIGQTFEAHGISAWRRQEQASPQFVARWQEAARNVASGDVERRERRKKETGDSKGGPKARDTQIVISRSNSVKKARIEEACGDESRGEAPGHESNGSEKSGPQEASHEETGHEEISHEEAGT
ncbi:MAG: hypothetical protein WD711_09220 [Dongiaceae bacterium]